MSFAQIKRYAFVPNLWIAPKYELLTDRILSKSGTLKGGARWQLVRRAKIYQTCGFLDLFGVLIFAGLFAPASTEASKMWMS